MHRGDPPVERDQEIRMRQYRWCRGYVEQSRHHIDENNEFHGERKSIYLILKDITLLYQMGISKTIKTPKQLWSLFFAYKTAIKKKPRHRFVLSQRTGKMVKEKLETPLTKEGFYNYVANQGIIVTLKDYFSDRDERYTEFVPICTRIREEIRQDQIEGGMVGQYNASLTARINGLADKTEVTGENGGPIQVITGMEII